MVSAPNVLGGWKPCSELWDNSLVWSRYSWRFLDLRGELLKWLFPGQCIWKFPHNTLGVCIYTDTYIRKKNYKNKQVYIYLSHWSYIFSLTMPAELLSRKMILSDNQRSDI